MAAIDRRIGVDGGDLFNRISTDPRALVQRHRSGLLRSGRPHHRRAVVQRDGHLRGRFSGQRSRMWCSARAATPERGEPTSGRWTICCGRRKRIRKSPFKTLPKGAEMIVAMRRSIRVGALAGSPLEEFGVAPDELHFMTRRDILEDNLRSAGQSRTNHPAAAVFHAVGHAGEPHRRARDCGERRVEASLVQGGPGDLPRGCLRRSSSRAFDRRSRRRGPVDTGHDRQEGQAAGKSRSRGVGSSRQTCRISPDSRPIVIDSTLRAMPPTDRFSTRDAQGHIRRGTRPAAIPPPLRPSSLDLLARCPTGTSSRTGTPPEPAARR